MAVSKLKSKSFLRGLKAENKVDDHKIVAEHISKIKQVAKKGNGDLLDMHIRELENYVKRMVQVQKNIVSKESNDFENLRAQVKDLRARLKLTSLSTPKQLDKIEFLLGEMNSRLTTYNNVQNRREQKMLELERKVNASIARNYSELLVVEKQIKSLENKYEKLKDNSDVDTNTLMRLENKINDLKTQLINKKAEIVERKQQEISQQIHGKARQMHLNELPERDEFDPLTFPKEPLLLEEEEHPLLEDHHEAIFNESPIHGLNDIPPQPENDLELDDFDTSFLDETEKEGFFKRIGKKIKSWFKR